MDLTVLALFYGVHSSWKLLYYFLKKDLTTLHTTNSKIIILLAWSWLLLMHMLQGLSILNSSFLDSPEGGCSLGKECYVVKQGYTNLGAEFAYPYSIHAPRHQKWVRVQTHPSKSGSSMENQVLLKRTLPNPVRVCRIRFFSNAPFQTQFEYAKPDTLKFKNGFFLCDGYLVPHKRMRSSLKTGTRRLHLLSLG